MSGNKEKPRPEGHWIKRPPRPSKQAAPPRRRKPGLIQAMIAGSVGIVLGMLNAAATAATAGAGVRLAAIRAWPAVVDVVLSEAAAGGGDDSDASDGESSPQGVSEEDADTEMGEEGGGAPGAGAAKGPVAGPVDAGGFSKRGWVDAASGAGRATSLRGKLIRGRGFGVAGGPGWRVRSGSGRHVCQRGGGGPPGGGVKATGGGGSGRASRCSRQWRSRSLRLITQMRRDGQSRP
jgi:hypothetical protein